MHSQRRQFKEKLSVNIFVFNNLNYSSRAAAKCDSDYQENINLIEREPSYLSSLMRLQ